MATKPYSGAGAQFSFNSPNDYALQAMPSAGIYKPVRDEFSDYELYSFEGWDGFSAAPITLDTVRAARVFARRLPLEAPRPDIAPGADGTIGFEWNLDRGKGSELIFVEVGPDMTIRAYREQGGRRREWPARLATIGAYTIAKELFERI